MVLEPRAEPPELALQAEQEARELVQREVPALPVELQELVQAELQDQEPQEVEAISK